VLVGDSAVTRALRDQIAGAARTSAKVLIQGETGSGKEVVARLIHAQSARRAGPLVTMNCSGIPETLLESELFGHTRGSFTGANRDTTGLLRQAHRGTLFLDELGEMSIRMQAVLLRFTESGEVQQVGADRPAGIVDVRLITATHRDLRAQIAAGAFREDLYYRLNVIQIQVPALRERGDDILTLTRHYLEKSGAAHGLPVPMLTPDVAQLLVAYSWPGNVRELKNVTERLVLQEPGEVITPDHLPQEIRGISDAYVVGPSSAHAALHASGPQPYPARRPEPSQDRGSDTVSHLWDLMMTGLDFWTVVYPAFKAREVTRTELAALVDRGLRQTAGSYTALLTLFHMPASDYKRFHAFLYQQQCNLPVAEYRRRKPRRVQVTADGSLTARLMVPAFRRPA
jgi:DNA-binding NtrC family response regulator